MINIENLRKIYNFIDALPDERVNMSVWRTAESGHPNPTTDLSICGTAACVVGWLPAIFNEETPRDFDYGQFSDKVGCTIEEAMDVCKPIQIDFSGEEDRTKEDALWSMRELANAYGHTI